MKQLFLTVLLLLGLTTAVQAEASPLRIAVIDTGISTVALGDDQVEAGKNYIKPSRDTADRNGHGTAVSDIIAQHTDAQLVPLVYYDQVDEDTAVRGDLNMLAAMIRDAVDVYHCHIINLSSGSGMDTWALRDAVAYAEQQGVLVVSAAGNDGTSAHNYPGVYPTVLCVGSVNPEGTGRAYFSNHYEGVDLLAPGISLSAHLIDGSETAVTGTSFSAAMVTGVVATLLEANPSLTPDQLRDILQTTATDLGAPGLDDETGYGLLNATSACERATAEHPFPFDDINVDDNCYPGVDWALRHGITSGITPTTFAPQGTCTRGQVVTFLWRAMGCPAPRFTENPFHDVGEEDYFYDAVLWAVEQDITKGTDNTTFSPNDPCSQAQVTTLLWRAVGCPKTAVATDFENQYYADAVTWAESKSLYQTAQVTFLPHNEATRADIVTYLYTALTHT